MDRTLQEASALRLMHACRFLGCGCQLIPLASGSKKPIEHDWPNKGISDLAELVRYWRTNMEHNFGVLTGRLFRIFVLDVDREVGKETLAALEAQHGPLPATVVTKTAHGLHYYFRYP